MEKDIFEQNLNCPICQTICVHPYESDCCGQLFCKKCIDNYSNSKCPLCRSYVKFRENTFIKKFMENYKVKCEYGCDMIIPISQMKYHRFQCEEALYNCSIFDCKIQLKLNQMLNHMTETHTDLSIILAEKFSGLKVVFDKHSIIEQIKDNQAKQNKENSD